MMNFRRQKDGSVTFPEKGVPPEKGPPGYVKDPNNPFRWIPELPECDHRFMGVNIDKKCNCETPVMKCRLLNDSIVSAIGCQNCTLEKHGIVNVNPSNNYLPCDTGHFPPEVWIAGKGPSLDKYDWSQAGWCRIGINETAYVVPDCLAASGTDNCILEMYAAGLPSTVKFVMISPTSYKRTFSKVLRWDTENTFGSGPSTVLTCIRMGATKVHLIGFDSIFGNRDYAKRLNVPQARMRLNVYDSVRESMRLIAAKNPKVRFEIFRS